jgi:predicted PurR-regulated permease PerM
MRKVFLLIVSFFIFLFGISLGGNFNKGSSQLFEQSKEEFENIIITPDNMYENIDLVPEDYVINKTAKKVEKIIDSVIDKIFSFLS